MKYEIFEDNAGGLYFCVLDRNDTCTRIFENWEYDSRGGNLREAVKEFMDDPDAFVRYCEGDITDRLYEYRNGEYVEDFVDRLYLEIAEGSEFIADGDTDTGEQWMDPNRMGAAGLLAFGLERP